MELTFPGFEPRKFNVFKLTKNKWITTTYHNTAYTELRADSYKHKTTVIIL